MEPERRTVRTKRGTREYTYRGCPLTRNRSAWCYRLCAPGEEGRGRCGRVAPHGLRSRTQDSIRDHNEKRLQAHCEKLEHLYLTAPCNTYCDSGIRVSPGQAEIVIPIQEEFLDAAGSVHGSICYAAMNDAAAYAVNSIVEDALVSTVEFTIQLMQPIAAGEMAARGQFLGMVENHLQAETVLEDSQGQEIGRGGGRFARGQISLTPENDGQ